MPKNNTTEKKAARALAAEKGINYTAALRIVREEKAARPRCGVCQHQPHPGTSCTFQLSDQPGGNCNCPGEGEAK